MTLRYVVSIMGYGRGVPEVIFSQQSTAAAMGRRTGRT